MTTMDDTPNPGSAAAIAAGCECPVIDNNHGRIPAMFDPATGAPCWWIVKGCPVHDRPVTDVDTGDRL